MTLARTATAALTLAATLAVAAATAAAQPTMASAPPEHDHTGFYLRAYLGPAYTRFHADDVDFTVSGNGGAFGLAIGGAVKPGLIVYGEVFDDIAVGPEVELGGMSGTASDDVSAGVVGFGVGVAKYFPSNVYVSGTLAMSSLTIQEDGRETGESEYGLGLSAMVGKEWWVSSQWGLGVAGQLFLGSMKEKDADYRYGATGVALVFSATYN